MEVDNTDITVETLPLLGVCNLCLHDGVVKSMLIKYEHDGYAETYVEMLLKCFSLDVLTVDLEDTKRLICDICIDKLRDAMHFRENVETSLKTLEATFKLQKQSELSPKYVKKELAIEDLIRGSGGIDSDDDHMDHSELSPKNVKKELAIEDLIRGSCGIDSDDDQMDAIEGAVYGVKQEYLDLAQDVRDATNMIINEKDLKAYHPKRTRRKTLTNKKKVSYSVKKNTDTSETENMLRAGLFPFKIYKDRTYSCVICSVKSTNLDDIKSHVSDHSLSNLHIAFKKISASKLQRFYKASSKLRCKLCKTDLSDYEELRQHIESCVRLNSRWNKLPFKLEKDQLDCPICKKKFLNFVNLNTHMNVHYPNYTCENCGKSFASKARLRGHMRTHEFGDFPCRYCDAVFDKATKRENHVSKEHKSGLRYACKRCNISLSSFYTRQKHLAEVHNEELKRYKCKACTQSYITPGHLSSHVRRDHLNERNHKCDKCDLAFYTKNALKMHMIKHDGERIHTCHICQKSYQRLKTLKEHMRIHNNDKRFICPVCGRAFTQKCTLKGHLKVHERKFDLDDKIVQPVIEPPVPCTERPLNSVVICRLVPSTPGD